MAPAGPGATPPAGSVAVVTAVVSALTSPALWLRALQAAAFGYALAAVTAILCFVAAAIAASTAIPASRTSTLTNGSTPVIGPEQIVGAVLMLVSMGFGSPAGVVVPIAGSEVTVSLSVIPLLIPLAAMAVVWWRSRRTRDLGAAASASAVYAVVTGALVATMSTGLAALMPISSAYEEVTLTLRAASAQGWIGALLVVGMAAWLGDRRRGQLPATWSVAVRAAAVHLGLLSAVLLVVVAVYAGTVDLVGFVPGVGINAALMGVAVALLGSIGVSGQGLPIEHDLAALSGRSVSLLSPDVPPLAWLGFALAVVLAVVAGVGLYRRGGASGPLTLVRTGVVWAAAGLLVQVASTASYSAQVSGSMLGGASAGVAASVGPTPATIAIFAAWGGAVGAIALWVAPVLGARQAPHGVAAVPASGMLTPVPAPTKRRHTVAKVGVGLGVSVAVLAAAVALGVPTIRASYFGPEAQARAYLADLESGDAATAISLTGAKPATGQSTALLTNDIYRKATDRPSAATVGNVTVAGDVASIDVSYTMAGEQKKSTLQATRTGTDWLVVDRWQLTQGLPMGAISVTKPQASARQLRVNGVKLADAITGDVVYAALPGTYRVDVIATPLLQGSNKTLTVSDSADPVILTVVEEPTTAFETAATAAANAAIAQCVASTEVSIGDTCPFTASHTPIEATNVSYQLVAPPTWDLVQGVSGWEVRTVSPATVHYKYTTPGLFGAGFDYESDVAFMATYHAAPNPDGTVNVTKI